jgi:hypothetical protein
MSERRRDFDERDDLDGHDDERRSRERASRRDDFDDDGPDLESRRDTRRRDLDDEEDDPVEPEPPRPSLLSKLILPVGGGLLAGAAVLSAAVVFLGGDEGPITPTAPQIVATGPQGSQAPQGVPSAPGPAPGLAPGFGQQQMAQVTPPRPAAPPPMVPTPAPLSAPVQASPGPFPVAPAVPAATVAEAVQVPSPVPPTAPARVEEPVIRELTGEVRAFRERVVELERLLQEQSRRMSDLNQDVSRQRQGNQALLAGIADLRAEIDEREAEIERLRSAMQRVMVANAAQEVAARTAAPQASTPAAPAAQPAQSTPASATPAAQEQRRPPVTQVPVRFANFNGFTRLTLAFPAEPVYDVDQSGDEVRVRFLGGELPSLLGLPAQIRNIESIATTPGVMEIRVAEGVNVRHAMLGTQVALTFHNRGLTPPETAGQPPRPRRPEPTPAAGASPPQEPNAPSSEPAAAAPSASPRADAPTPPAPPQSASRQATAPVQPQAAQVDLSGLRLRSVSRRAVLIETEDGEIHRVELGQTLPGVSAIAQEVRRDGDVWVLVTSGGVLRP